MKKYLKLDILTRAEVPHELDLRILAAAKLRHTAARRRRRTLRFLACGAAAAVLCAAAGVTLLPGNLSGKSKISSEDYARLAALSDWSWVEQETYNLSGEAAWGNTSSNDFSDLKTFTEV